MPRSLDICISIAFMQEVDLFACICATADRLGTLLTSLYMQFIIRVCLHKQIGCTIMPTER